MSTYLTNYPTKKAFRAAVKELGPAAIVCRDPSIQPGSRSGTISNLFSWGIRYFTVTNQQRQWYAEVSQGKRGQAVVK